MNPSTIWWEQIGNSLRFLGRAAAQLRDHRSALLILPQGLPWRQTFQDALDARRTAMGSDRRLVRLRWHPGADPGALLLETLCDEAVAAEYWPGQSYGEYLASKRDLALNECCVWVTGIHSKADLARWTDFIRVYERFAQPPELRAIFLLEYCGEAPEQPGIDCIEYRVRDYDCRVFCLELAAALQNTELTAYQAELALRIGQSDPEFCAALLEQGAALLRSPSDTVGAVTRQGLRSSGEAFPLLTDQQITSAVWKAATVLLFPILEQYRLDFAARHQAALRCRLPISNSSGESITDPFDLEIGPLHYVVSALGEAIPAGEREQIRLCHRVRNLLAHNKSVPCPDIQRVLALS